MHREYEPERRRLRDDADAAYARQLEYERRKAEIIAMNLDADEYMARIKTLSNRLGM